MNERFLTDDNAVRSEVSDAYSQALARAKASGGSCCGSKPAGNAAQLVDYAEDTADLPQEAVRSSFGCGNPLAFSEVQAGQTVLDLGSGAGLDLLIASRKVGPEGRVIGVDMTDDMLAEAAQNVRRAGVSNVDLRKGTIEALPVDDASVDWIISNCVINLSPDKAAVFAEIARVLRPGGRIAISDIVVEELPEELRRHAAVRAACIGGAISESEYVRGLEAAGLQGVEVSERLVYAAEQLQTIIGVDESQLEGLTPEFLREAADAVTGKVWSARFCAVKPT